MTGRSGRVEIITRTERRRRWTDEQKLELVRQSLSSGSSVGVVARQHDIAPSQLFTWRKQALTGMLTGFVPIEVTDSPLVIDGSGSAVPVSDFALSARRGGLIEVDTPNSYRIRVGPDVDGAALARVLSAIAGVAS